MTRPDHDGKRAGGEPSAFATRLVREWWTAKWGWEPLKGGDDEDDVRALAALIDRGFAAGIEAAANKLREWCR